MNNAHHALTQRRRSAWIMLMLASLLPLLYTASWLIRNHQLPCNDAANYLLSAVNIYQAFADHGLVHGLFRLYAERGWRPIIFPNLAAPFLLISKGNMFFAYQSVALLCVLATTIYSYMFFRLRLNRIPALLGANLIGLLPFIQAQALMFYAEAALFPCVIGCLYHLIKSGYLRDLRHSAAFVLLLSLSLMIRPVEAVTNLVFVFMLFLYDGWRQQFFSTGAVIRLFLCLSAAAFLFFTAAYYPYWHHGMVNVMDGGGVLDRKMARVLMICMAGSGSTTLILWLLNKIIMPATRPVQRTSLSTSITLYQAALAQRLKQSATNPLLVPAFIAISVLTLLWFLPVAYNTYEWIYRTSLGDVASSTGSLSGPSFSVDVLSIYLREEGIAVIGGTLIAALAGWIALTWRQRKVALLSTPFLYLILLLPFPFWEAFYTVQVVTRKLSLAFPAILMALLMLALSNGKWLRARSLFVGLLVLMQAGLLFKLLFTDTYQHPVPSLTRTIGYFIPQPSTIRPNPHDVVMDFFATQANLHHLRSFGLELVPGTPDARHPIEAEPINPFLMSTMLQSRNTPYYAGYPYFSVYSEENVRSLSSRFDAVFVSDTVSAMTISPAAAAAYQKRLDEEQSASVKIFFRLMQYYSGDQLAIIGFKRGPCIVIKTQKSGDYLGCLLFSTRSPTA